MRPIDLKPTCRAALMLCVAAFLTLPSAAAFAQSTGEGEGEGEEEYFYDEKDDNPKDARFVYAKNQWGLTTGYWAKPKDTTTVTDAVTGSYRMCSRLQDEAYFVDCLGEQLEEIAKAMPEDGDYVEAKKILAEAAAEIRQVAAANAEPAKPRIRAQATVQGKQIRTKPLTPVRTERIAAAKQQAAAILEEAETKLLRSAEASDRRLIAYAQMAKAVGSNKTLLRSA